MEIITCQQKERAKEFNRIKRKKWSQWHYLVSGEWAQDIYHSGNTIFCYSYTKDCSCWALLEQAFPRKIVAVAINASDIEPAFIIASMMYKLFSDGGSYLELINYYNKKGEVNFDEVWQHYRSLKKSKSNR